MFLPDTSSFLRIPCIRFLRRANNGEQINKLTKRQQAVYDESERARIFYCEKSDEYYKACSASKGTMKHISDAIGRATAEKDAAYKIWHEANDANVQEIKVSYRLNKNVLLIGKA